LGGNGAFYQARSRDWLLSLHPAFVAAYIKLVIFCAVGSFYFAPVSKHYPTIKLVNMLFRQLFLLILGTAFGLSVHAQTSKTMIGAPQKKTTYQPAKKKPATKKTPAAAKDSVKTAGPVKDTVVVTQAVQAPPPPQRPVVTTPAANAPAPAIEKPVAQMNSPFKAGTLRLSHQSMVSLHQFNRKGIDPGKDNILDATVNLTWFPVNGLGVGIDARYYKSKYTTPGTGFDISSWSTYFHLMYGYSFNDRYHAFVKVGYGPSKSDSKSQLGQSNTRLKSSYKDLAFSVGAPVRLEKQGQLFITPAFTYDQYKGTAATHDIKDKTFGFALRPESYLPLSSGDKKQAVNYYAKGTQFIDYNSRFEWRGTTRNESQGNAVFVPRKLNTRILHAGYGLYVVDNIAAGLNLEINHIKNTMPGSSADVRNFISLQPSVLAQVPVEGPLNHLFGQVSYEFRKGKESGQVKTSQSNLDLRVGYHLFMSKNLALTPRIGYSMLSDRRKYVSSDITRKSKGLAGELVLRAWLDWKWLK
jgi:hypothetical protein